MKYYLLFFMLIWAVGTLKAQEDGPVVTRVFTIETPSDYSNTHSIISWSPNGALFAVRFTMLDEGNSPIAPLWQIYDVTTGKQLHEVSDFVAWYTDNRRALVRIDDDASPAILDLQTGQIVALLEDAGARFLDGLIKDVIVTLDKANILRIYDAATGAVRFSSEAIADLPAYSPDGTQFALNILGSGVEIYHAESFLRLYHLEGYRISGLEYKPWSPNSQQVVVSPLDVRDNQRGPRYIWTLNEGLSAPIDSKSSFMVWSPDGAYITVSYEPSNIRVYSAATGKLSETIPGSVGDSIGVIEWQGAYLFTRSHDAADIYAPPLRLGVWDFNRDKFIFEGNIDLGYTYWIEGGELVLLESFIGLRYISLDTGRTRQILEFERSLGPLSPDRQWIVGRETPFEEGVPTPIFVYRLNPLELIATLEGHTEIVRSISWSPDSRHFLSRGGPNLVILWELQKDTK